MKATTAALASISTAALFLVAGCGSAEGPAMTTTSAVTETVTDSQTPGTGGAQTTEPSAAAPSPTAPVESSTPDVPPLGDPDQGQKSQSPEGSYDLSVTEVRVAEHESFTRVVFDIGGSGTPGWWTNYQDSPAQQASGLPVEVAGDSFLEVSIDGIALPMDAAVPGVEMGSFTGAGIVEEVTLTTIFEARAQFFIGIAGGHRDYSVTLLNEPTRVVVDIIH